jgi:uncharacterized protein
VNVYVDSSALVKLLIAEPESEDLLSRLSQAKLFTCRVTYAETRATIARRAREAPGRAQEWSEARNHLDADWGAFGIIEVVQSLVLCAGEFADVFALRGYDSIQLAAGHSAHSAAMEDMSFFSYDRRLNRAARLLGLNLPEDAWL